MMLGGLLRQGTPSFTHRDDGENFLSPLERGGGRSPSPPLLGAKSVGIGILALLLTAGAAQADEPSASAQLAGLFIQGCLRFAGDASALRVWAGRTGLPDLPEAASKAFLHGAPGRTFDASVSGTKLVLVSSDDGICAAMTDNAATDAVSGALEGGLSQAGIAFRLAIDRDDTNAKALHFREYLATRYGRSWRILAATVNSPSGHTPGHNPPGGQAMLTAAPE
jgi:hypothetical protein